MTRRKAIITIILFMILTGSAFLIWPFVRGELEGVNTENRNLASFPAFSFETISEYPDQIEAWMNDHLPFRAKMIGLQSLIDYYLLHTSSNSNVVIGKDGWLFLKADDSMEYYTGRKLYSEEQLRTLAGNLQIAKDAMKRQGTEFVLMVIPDRERIYPEKLPSCYGAPNPVNAFDQLTEYLRENTDITVVCPYDSLMKAKEENPDQILYHKTDSHWNDLGAYIGVCDLFQALDIKWDKSRVTVTEVEDTPGDMADMLNLRGMIDAGWAYQLSGFQNGNTFMTAEPDFWGHYTYESPDAGNGRILVLRDSFCSAMMQFISEAFQESDLVHHDGFCHELIEQEQPDYFVYEVVERKLDQLLDDAQREREAWTVPAMKS